MQKNRGQFQSVFRQPLHVYDVCMPAHFYVRRLLPPTTMSPSHSIAASLNILFGHLARRNRRQQTLLMMTGSLPHSTRTRLKFR
ncbi:hypothetical protein B0H19DRAFT_1194878 [Mycena capillaripes]|nr:hypothetical protein B0H19DRAFT_1194878 [Mycena capillaripes]